MTPLDFGRLIGKQGAHCEQALTDALKFALVRQHYNVELEHWLLKLLDTPDNDFSVCFKHFEVDIGVLAADLNKALERLRRGNTRPPGFSQQVVDLLESAWFVASVTFDAARVRSGHLLLTLLSDEPLSRWTREASPEFAKIGAEQLRLALVGLTKDSIEAQQEPDPDLSPARGDRAIGAPPAGSALDRFTLDVTGQAREGRIDPVLGRDAEIRQVIDVLMRRRQNNPILTGEAGVGKTSVVEGFAQKIAAGDVPVPLKTVAVRTLDLGLLQAGAGVKGEFENRLKQVIDEVKASVTPIVLFIDEAHTLIGAGGQAGQNDAANLLKPALARGELRTIAATTWAEYKKYFERDAALTRRFQVVKVAEPDDRTAIGMMRGLVGTLEVHHSVRILDAAVVDSVRLSRRYIPARQLPDKSVSILDTACARVAMSQGASPALLDDCRQRIASIDTEMQIHAREAAVGGKRSGEMDDLTRHRSAAASELADLERQWAEEKSLVNQLHALRRQLEPADPVSGNSVQLDSLRAQYESTRAQLKKTQGERPLVHPEVDAGAVAEVIANWTGIPLGRMVANELNTVLNLQELMSRRIVGQPQALEAIAEAIRTSRAHLTDPRKPIGVFLMVGTSGVGKTETALTLAELLYGGEQNLTVINMSEFKEEHKVSMLVGAPPGYVGFGEGGVLTEAVRRRPYSVVLLDEIEKAHPGVQDVFYQVFDKGQLRDGEGRDIDFRNTVIIMTSNAAQNVVATLCADPQTAPEPADLVAALRPELLKIFKPAFLGRVTIVPYYPLTDAVLRQIIRLQLEQVRKRVAETYRAGFEYPDELIANIAARCREVESGARNVESIIARGLLPALSSQILSSLAKGEEIHNVSINIGSDGNILYRLISPRH
jgi:type VI secretion system protein VasG